MLIYPFFFVQNILIYIMKDIIKIRKGVNPMISNQILQNTIDGLKAISRIDLCILDLEGKVYATTFPVEEEYRGTIVTFVNSPADSQAMQDYQIFKIKDDVQVELILLARGTSDDVFMVGKMAAFQIQGLLVAYKERFDKDNFIKNLLLDNLLLVDIYNRTKKLHIDVEGKRIVFIVETENEKGSNVLENVRNMFSTKANDFITAVDEKNTIIVKEVKQGESYAEMYKIAKMVYDSLSADNPKKVNISYGTIVNDIKEVSKSYKEAKMALDVGKIFFTDKNIVAYNNLGIGRLIYQLPMPLCKMFIKEIFDGKSPDDFDEETLITINKFLKTA